MKNSGDNVFEGIPAGEQEASLFDQFLRDHDFSPHTRRAFANDVRKFARWFSTANHEPFVVGRVTVRDITDFRDHIRRDGGQAVATVNRCLVTLRRFFAWLTDKGLLTTNPARPVKELTRQVLAPKGLDRAEVRRLLREVELRGDVRANGVFSLFLWTGCRVSDLTQLEITDLMLSDRSGMAVFKYGKGGKQRSVPLPLAARRAVQAYLDTRPPVQSGKVFIGERGPLTNRGVRAMCDKYAAITGIKTHPHLLQHSFAHQFLANSQNDIVALAQILGHENLNTTARYTKRTGDQLADAADKLSY